MNEATNDILSKSTIADQEVLLVKPYENPPFNNPEFLNHTHNGVDSPLINIRANAMVGGLDTEVQFNDRGSLNGNAGFTYDKINQILSVSEIDANPNSTIDLDLRSLDAQTASDRGGNITIAAGDNGSSASLFNDAGSINITAGNNKSSRSGGDIFIVSGNGGLDLAGGGGDIVIQAGSAGDLGGRGGSIFIYPGASTGSTILNGDLILLANVNGNSSAKQGRVIITDGIVPKGQSFRLVGEIKTTNATPTDYKIEVITNIANTYFIEAKVVAQRTGGSSGTAHDSAGFVRRAVFKNSGDDTNFTVVGSVQDDFTVSDQAWTATIVYSNFTFFLEVTGAANNNITWHFEILYIIAR